MNAIAYAMPELDRIRHRFLDLLNERKMHVAQYALAAWDGETVENINQNLEAARSILQEIAGSARTVGYPELGITAQQCEAQIIAHLEGDYADLAICPGEIVWFVDRFVEACDAI